jgi:hypothetical protein
MSVELDHAGIGKFLKETMRGPIDDLARLVAANVDVGSVTEAEVTVRSYTTDRAAAAVSIAHPAGLAIQAKHGALTKALSSQGLTLRSKK